MSDWSEGYVADVDYVYTYHRELNPSRLPLLFLSSGLVFPKITTACELGFGQGVSINIHAAASEHVWYGTDFNPTQAAFAQELATASGAAPRLFDQSFAEFCERADLPDFDFIGIHGIWSWISNENQTVIVDFVRRKLKVGGVLYIAYNMQPGWATMIPMQRLMAEHTQVAAVSDRDPIALLEAAIDFLEKLLRVDPLFARANPIVNRFITAIKQADRRSLVHEYLNRDWMPISFAEMTKRLAQAKLTYACSANFRDHVQAIDLTTPQQAFLAEISDKTFRQSVRDLMVNQQFRRDYWVKGPRRLSSLERVEALARQQVILVSAPAKVVLDVSSVLGHLRLDEAIYTPIIERLSNHKPSTIGEIAQVLASSGPAMLQLQIALMTLAEKGDLAQVRDEAGLGKVKAQIDKLNLYMLTKARSTDELGYLASPVTGGGIAVPRVHQLFLLAIAAGCKTPKEWAKVVWQLLSARGEIMQKEGRPFETAEQQMAQFSAEAKEFETERLPILRALQIA
jgi:SAM-dependent methyltransferase